MSYDTAVAPSTTVAGTRAAPGAGLGLAYGLSSVAGIGAGAYSQWAAGQENRDIARYNAAMLRLRARDSIFRGQLAEQKLRGQTKRLIGAQRASLAAQGIAVDSGTAAKLQEDSAYQGEMDALTLRNNALREAFGFGIDADQTTVAGRAAERAGNSNALGTIAGGMADMAGTYYRARL